MKVFFNFAGLLIILTMVLANCTSVETFDALPKPGTVGGISSSEETSSYGGEESSSSGEEESSSSSEEESSSSGEEESSSSGGKERSSSGKEESSSSSGEMSSASGESNSSSDDSSSSLGQSSSSSEEVLCGNKPYSPSEEGCCVNLIYYLSFQFCQGNTKIESLCGGDKTYTTEELCQGGNVITNQCGTEWYHSSTHFCQGGTTVKDLCGTATYTETEFCQSPDVVKALCDTQTYTASQFCDSRDNKVYKKVTIDTQTWMAENLKYNANSSMCYNNQDSDCATYGRLYNWTTAMGGSTNSTANPSGVQGVCPPGWHLPSYAEWDALTSFIESKEICGGCAAKHLKAVSGWNSNGNGLDSYGFAAFPGGYGYYTLIHDYNYSWYNTFVSSDVGGIGYWWSATQSNANDAYYRRMDFDKEIVGRYSNAKNVLYSVRCLQD